MDDQRQEQDVKVREQENDNCPDELYLVPIFFY